MSQAPKLIKFWNRAESREDVELVYGDKAMRWVYETTPGQFLFAPLVSQKWFSQLYGSYQDTHLSAKKIKPFVNQFKINMDEYIQREYFSFNEFFIRAFKPGVRKFESDPNRMPAFAEARYLAYEKVRPEQTFPVKGADLTAHSLLADHKLSKMFEGGPLIIARLCPVDYHRFHFPDDGVEIEEFSVFGPLHSVNPVALRYKSDIFATNERHISILETKNFGTLAYIEVGALCVGKIVQSHKGTNFSRGEEKGYFLFGGSTVILMGEPGKWKPDDDILEQSHVHGRECYIKLGSAIAHT